MARSVVMRNFVLAGPGEWTRADSLDEAVSLMRGRLGYGKRLSGKTMVIAFASDQPLDVGIDDRVRVFAKDGAALVQFEMHV